MGQHDLTWKEASPCSIKNMPVPEAVVCPACGADTEVWPDDAEALCHACKGCLTKKDLNPGSTKTKA